MKAFVWKEAVEHRVLAFALLAFAGLIGASERLIHAFGFGELGPHSEFAGASVLIVALPWPLLAYALGAQRGGP